MTTLVRLAMDDGAKRIDQPIFSMVRPLDWQNGKILLNVKFFEQKQDLHRKSYARTHRMGGCWGHR